jgi:hypothetical protein
MTRPVQHAARRRQRGQAMVEGALVAILFISSLLMILELGRYMLLLQFFTERARAGARQAAISTYDPATIKNWIVYNSPSAPPGGQGGAGLLGLTPAMIAVNRYNPGTDTDRIEVGISNYPISLFIPMLPGQWTLKPFRVVFTAESLGATN